MSNDTALFITTLTFLELGWYYSAALVFVVLVIYVLNAIRIRAQAFRLAQEMADGLEKLREEVKKGKE